MLRLGRLIERADMTTRVLGVAAASILAERLVADEVVHDQVRWMSVLRSVSALQMYQRSDHGPIEGEAWAWWVVVDVWTAEEGRSDLSMEATLSDDGSDITVKVRTVHVM